MNRFPGHGEGSRGGDAADPGRGATPGLSDARRRALGRLQRSKTRRRAGQVLVEGVRSVEEVLAAGTPIRWAAGSPRLVAGDRGRALWEALGAAGVDRVWMDDRDLAREAHTEAPQGVLVVVDEPHRTLAGLPPARRVLLVDGVQDPGNLGTLIRTARAFGVDAVVVLDGSADPWGSKAVRSAAGAAFHVLVAQASWPDVRSWMEGQGLDLLAAAADGTDVSTLAVPDAWALAVGSEARGVRPELAREAGARVAVPMAPGAESLNAGVAGAILLYALSVR